MSTVTLTIENALLGNPCTTPGTSKPAAGEKPASFGIDTPDTRQPFSITETPAADNITTQVPQAPFSSQPTKPGLVPGEEKPNTDFKESAESPAEANRFATGSPASEETLPADIVTPAALGHLMTAADTDGRNTAHKSQLTASVKPARLVCADQAHILQIAPAQTTADGSSEAAQSAAGENGVSLKPPSPGGTGQLLSPDTGQPVTAKQPASIPFEEPVVDASAAGQESGKALVFGQPGAAVAAKAAAGQESPDSQESSAVNGPGMAGRQQMPVLQDASGRAQATAGNGRLDASLQKDETTDLTDRQNGRKTNPGRLITEPPQANSSQPRNTTTDSHLETLLEGLNPQRVQLSSAQPKGCDAAASNSAEPLDLEQMLSAGNIRADITGQLSSLSQPAGPAGNTSIGNLSAGVGQQLEESIHSLLSQGGRQITIQLNPPELGRVFIKFRHQSDQLTGLLEVDRPQTRAEIQQVLPRLLENLADAGIVVKRLDVVLSQQQTSQQQTSQQQPYKDQFAAAGENGAFGQNGSSESGYPESNWRFTDRWPTWADGYAEFFESPDAFIADSSINVGSVNMLA